jgi:2-amino-4-hydroxy-6-hydroxymethyldihydropteridine diphosphokinase
MRKESNRRHVFLGLGSNINPGHNVSEMIMGLLALEPVVHVSRVIRTPPVGMASDHEFLNLSAHLETDRDLDTLKQALNDLEVRLGRNRQDPDSARRDRPADLDILFALPVASRQIRSHMVPLEPYARPLFLELIHAMSFACSLPPVALPAGVPIRLSGRFVGIQPTRVTLSNQKRLRVQNLPLRRIPVYLGEKQP